VGSRSRIETRRTPRDEKPITSKLFANRHQVSYKRAGRRWMNLFWETRRLTQEREDHLTCFLAAALGTDAAFRHAYAQRVLSSLAKDGRVPEIAAVETQPVFREESCRPDLLLRLTDGRVVVCEHKLEAPETPRIVADREVKLQLERYLGLKVEAVAYFRPFPASVSKKVVSHEKYLRPASADHFLWRDLYEPLMLGTHVVSAWLRDGFERLGFTPPVPHVGELWPDHSAVVRRNQKNFAKLWDRTRAHASIDWKVNRGRRCELFLLPRKRGLVSQVYVSPLAQGGSLLRIRAQTTDERIATVRKRIEAVVPRLPTPAEVAIGRHAKQLRYCDVLAPLHLILGGSVDAGAQEARLFGQVGPVLDALRPGG
jgi:hypothetical protein